MPCDCYSFISFFTSSPYYCNNIGQNKSCKICDCNYKEHLKEKQLYKNIEKKENIEVYLSEKEIKNQIENFENEIEKINTF